MGLLFEKPSLRTSVSFETLMAQLGGSSLFLGEDVGWGKREPLRDFMPILTSYLDVLVIRAKSHEKVQESLEFSRCPIINGLTDVSHPCQALADIMTVMELEGGLEQTPGWPTLAMATTWRTVWPSFAAGLGVPLTIGAPSEISILQVIYRRPESTGGSGSDQPNRRSHSRGRGCVNRLHRCLDQHGPGSRKPNSGWPIWLPSR